MGEPPSEQQLAEAERLTNVISEAVARRCADAGSPKMPLQHYESLK